MDKLISRALAFAALLAGAGVFYYFVIYLPGIESHKSMLSAQRTESYKTCVSEAQYDYVQSWAVSCHQQAGEKNRRLKNCLANPSIVNNPYMGRAYCESQFGGIDNSNNCQLYGGVGAGLNQLVTKRMNQCNSEANLIK